MTRDELIESLSDLRDYHTVTEQICEYLNLDLLRNDLAYNAGNDSRISVLLEYMSPTETGFSKYIDYTAFTIVANMARYNLNIPTDDQMREMLKISGYSAEEMKKYVQSGRPRKASCISATHLVPSVCLLSRVLADTMMDRSEWQGYRKGKKRNHFTPAPNPSRQKLQRLIEYMDENDLLYLDDTADEEYREFVCNHARYMCRLACINGELKTVSDAIRQRQREFAKELKCEMESLRKKNKKGTSRNAKNESSTRAGGAKSAKTVPLAPLASPTASGASVAPLSSSTASGAPFASLLVPSASNSPFAPLADPAASIASAAAAASMEVQPSVQDISSMQSSKKYLSRSQNKDLRNLREAFPEMDALFQRMEQFDNEASIRLEECWAISDRLAEENADDRMEYVSEEFVHSVAMGLFQAIRNGDEIYKLKIGRVVMEDLMSVSEMPLPGSFNMELDDEDDWDYACPECNGKLALPIIKEGDCISFPLNEREETIRYAVPVTAVISRYAEQPFEAPLYIRKSLISKFKESGCSDRKAREYAIIVATLELVNHLNEDDYRFAFEYPAPIEKETAGTKEAAGVKKAIGAKKTIEAGKTTGEKKVTEAEAETDYEGTLSQKTTDASIEKEIAARKDAERALRQAQKENQVCRHEISTLQREIEKLKNRLAEKEQKEQAAAKNGGVRGAGNSGKAADDSDEFGEPPGKAIGEAAGRVGGEASGRAGGKTGAETTDEAGVYPYHTKLKVVLYGGFDVFHRELLKLMPDVRVVEITAHIDVNPIRNADIVFLQINKTDHSGYWTVCDACKNSGVPYVHLNYASARRCAGVMVEEIEKLKKTMA